MAMPLIPLSDLSPEQGQQVRLIATDMDGTLTRHGKFTPALLQMLEALKQAGIPVLIVTGRSAGWVNAVVAYLPVWGAIAENGGLLYTHPDVAPQLLVSLPSVFDHRRKLAEMFAALQAEFPKIQEAADNRYRLTDWTYDVAGLTMEELERMGDRCRSAGWDFTYSTVQCHIKSPGQEKAIALLQVLKQHFSDLSPEQVITVGDSPNDESLFDGDRFPVSVGVANVLHYTARLMHKPAYVTQGEEAEGFCEVGRSVLKF